MSEKYAVGTVESRREKLNGVQDQLHKYYADYWNVAHISDVEENRSELRDSDGRNAVQLLECADIDTLIDTYDKQIAVQEKLIYSSSGICLSLRMENNHPHASPEADRFRDAYKNGTALIPNVIAYGKVVDKEVTWLQLIDVDAFLESWLEENIVDEVYTGNGVNDKLFFEPQTVADTGAVMATWGSVPQI